MNAIFRNWSFIRLIRLGLGLAIMIQGIRAADKMMGLIGLLFATMAILSAGCCPASPVAENTNGKKEIEFEEVM